MRNYNGASSQDCTRDSPVLVQCRWFESPIPRYPNYESLLKFTQCTVGLTRPLRHPLLPLHLHLLRGLAGQSGELGSTSLSYFLSPDSTVCSFSPYLNI